MKTITAFVANDQSLHQTRGQAAATNLINLLHSAGVSIDLGVARKMIQSRAAMIVILQEADSDVATPD